METRIVTTADIFDALTADHPYRCPMPLPKALGIMQGETGAAIDEKSFAALRRSTERMDQTEAAEIDRTGALAAL